MRCVAKRRDQWQLDVDDVVLRYIAHRATQLHQVRCRIDPVERDRALLRWTDRCHRFEQSGFAGAAAPHDRHEFARLDRERDVVENTLPVINGPGQATNLDSETTCKRRVGICMLSHGSRHPRAL